MKKFLNELIDYNFEMNQRILDFMKLNESRISNKSHKLISHILVAHEIWNNRLIYKVNSKMPWELIELSELREMNKFLTQQSKELLANISLDTILEYKNTKGEEFQNSFLDILYHILNHGNYHRAQINTEFVNVGLNAVVMDYIFYKRS